jgi:hypothetical protein
MPTVFIFRGFRFFFYSNEGSPREPIHIHVEKDGDEAKFWLRPEVTVAYNDGYSARTLHELLSVAREKRELIEGHGMNSSVSATAVRFDEDSMWVDLSDGRVIGVPLAWFPRLLNASEEQRHQLRISSRGLHWESLDEDISISGLLEGFGDLTGDRKIFAA